MPNTGYNTFVIILGFCLLGLPIMMISMSTAPPGPMKFQSTINFSPITGDSQSGIYLNETVQINGSSEDYWDYVKPLSELSYINNLTELILTEQDFMENASIDDYVGFSKNVHVFILEMIIEQVPSYTETMSRYLELFDSSNGTFLSYMYQLDDYHAFYYTEPTYPSVNDTINTIYSNYGSLDYLVSVTFYANVVVDGDQMSTEFSRLLLLDNLGNLLFFVSNEAPWTQVT